MRRRLKLVLWVGLLFAGCITAPPYGYLVHGTVPPHMPERLAHDTVTRMEEVYPPAVTRLALTHPATDAYGVALTETLRRKGYGVVEYREQTRPIPSTRDDMPTRIESAGSREDGIPFRYVVDGPLEEGLYRVSVFVGQQSLSRAYRMDQHAIAQAGAWVRKE